MARGKIYIAKIPERGNKWPMLVGTERFNVYENSKYSELNPSNLGSVNYEELLHGTTSYKKLLSKHHNGIDILLLGNNAPEIPVEIVKGESVSHGYIYKIAIMLLKN